MMIIKDRLNKIHLERAKILQIQTSPEMFSSQECLNKIHIKTKVLKIDSL